jgi:phenylpyruvate tautomerase PptA (4-oxalocrotonate tautomerase family)
MPILDIELVQPDGAAPPAAVLTQALADAAGRVLGAAPGRIWVRLRVLPASQYAENEAVVAADEQPVFATVLHAHLPQGDALAAEAAALTQALAACLGRSPQRVHVQYAPAAAGRQAFGGVLVR